MNLPAAIRISEYYSLECILQYLIIRISAPDTSITKIYRLSLDQRRDTPNQTTNQPQKIDYRRPGVHQRSPDLYQLIRCRIPESHQYRRDKTGASPHLSNTHEIHSQRSM